MYALQVRVRVCERLRSGIGGACGRGAVGRSHPMLGLAQQVGDHHFHARGVVAYD